MSENSDKYQRAVQNFSAVVDAVPSDKWDAASPCEGWTARHVIGHVIGGMQVISAVQTGVEAEFGDPLAAAGDDPATNYTAARDLALESLTEENLAQSVDGPGGGKMPLDQLIGMILANDVLIHTWDLAKATGGDATLDPELCEAALQGLEPMDAMVRSAGVFGAKVDAPADADVQTKLICFTGRRP
ncbi:MAG: TIGR03086 family metal-binding protein [Acidimicrobiales bacterium]|nr:TIGR03086 family metal-binding protein [Acidimicrobiales bacterium]